MKTRTARLAALAGVPIVVVASAAVAAPPAERRIATAAANTACWDFSDLPQTTEYRIGDTFTAEHADIEFKHYLLNGNKVTNPAALAQATNTQISRSDRPELRTCLINAHVEPNAPLRAVTLKFGHTGSANGPHTNIGVNGELKEVSGSLTGLNGQVLGNAATGRVAIVVNLDDPQADPQTGTMELHAIKGAIEKFTFGGVQFFVDDVCLKK
ncbi:MAG: hypothetical protein GEU99_02720 [Luteitalea sp.]|nr:hypothetical protein [Luteitalea sp.]